MENTKKLLMIFGSAKHLYSCRLFQKLWFKKKLMLDCYEFGALEINRVVDSTYNNYQSPPYNSTRIYAWDFYPRFGFDPDPDSIRDPDLIRDPDSIRIRSENLDIRRSRIRIWIVTCWIRQSWTRIQISQFFSPDIRICKFY